MLFHAICAIGYSNVLKLVMNCHCWQRKGSHQWAS